MDTDDPSWNSWEASGINNTISDIEIAKRNGADDVNVTAKLVPYAYASGCFVTIGRPFRSRIGQVNSAQVVMYDGSSSDRLLDVGALWSTPYFELPNRIQVFVGNEPLAASWIYRALGEHASIALKKVA